MPFGEFGDEELEERLGPFLTDDGQWGLLLLVLGPGRREGGCSAGLSGWFERGLCIGIEIMVAILEKDGRAGKAARWNVWWAGGVVRTSGGGRADGRWKWCT